MQEVSYSLPHLQLNALRFGTADKSVVLALHGWLDNAASFLPLSEYLDVQHYQFVALDLAGHGLSQHRSADAHYHLVDWVQDIHYLITQNQWQQVVLVGHSLGGIIASLYASCFPEHVSKLLLIESFGPYCKDPETSPQQLRESVLSRIEINNKTAKHPASLKNAITARKMAGDMNKASAELLVNRNLQETESGLKWRTDRRLRTISSLRMTEPQVEAFMRSIECPVRVILGQQGFEKVKDLYTKRQDWLKQVDRIILNGGHHLHMDYPQSVSVPINEFVAT